MDLNDDFEQVDMWDVPDAPAEQDEEILAPEPLPQNDQELAVIANPPEVVQYNEEAPVATHVLFAGAEEIPDVVSTLHPGHISHGVHESQKSILFRNRCQLKDVRDWWIRLTSVNELAHIVETLRNTPLSSLFGIPILRSDVSVSLSLVERWQPRTHTFHFPCGELGITPLDFTMLTGVRIGIGERLPYDANLDTRDRMTQIFPHMADVTDSQWTQGKVNMARIKTAYKTPLDSIEGVAATVVRCVPGSAAALEYCRAFLLYVIGALVFPHSKGIVAMGHLAAMEPDIAAMWNYDYGGAMLHGIYTELDAACGHVSLRERNFLGYLPVVEFWYYTYVGSLGPIVTHIPDWIPRIMGLLRAKAPSARDRQQDCVAAARTQIEIRTHRSIRWRPWFRTQYFSRVVVQRALRLSRSRIVLRGIGAQQCWYLGDRCWRQLTGLVAMPQNPPAHVTDASDVTPADVDQRYAMLGGWPETEDYAYVTQDAYTRYWRRVSMGRLLPTCYRAGNADYFGPTALRSDMALPGPSQPSASGYSIDAYIPPPEDPAGVVVWTTQGTTMALPVPPVPEDIAQQRVQELLPQLHDWDADQLRQRLSETTLRMESQTSALYAYTGAITQQYRVAQEGFSSSQQQIHELFGETARLQTEIDRLRLDAQRRAQADEGSTSRRRAAPSGSGSRGGSAQRARRG